MGETKIYVPGQFVPIESETPLANASDIFDTVNEKSLQDSINTLNTSVTLQQANIDLLNNTGELVTHPEGYLVKKYSIGDIFYTLTTTKEVTVKNYYVAKQSGVAGDNIYDETKFINAGTSSVNAVNVRTTIIKNNLQGDDAYEVYIKQWIEDNPNLEPTQANGCLSKKDWLNSLEGDSAYESACKRGYNGSMDDWLASLIGESAYDEAVNEGFEGTKSQWINSLHGKSATEIYNELNPSDVLTDAEFIKKIKASYPMNYLEYNNDAEQAAIGTQFSTINSISASIDKVGTLWCMPNDSSDPDGVIAFSCINTGSDVYKWVKLGPLSIPSNTLTEDHIVDDVTKGGSTKVLSAEQGRLLGLKTRLANVTETKVEVTSEMITDNKYVRVNYTNNGDKPGDIESASNNKITTISLDGTETYLRFYAPKATDTIGYAFYDSNIDEDNPNGHVLYASGLNTRAEHLVKVPYGAAKFICLSARNAYTQSSFYCYKVYGNFIDKPSSKIENNIKQQDDIAKAIIKLGGINNVEITPLPFSFYEKGIWNATTNSLEVSSIYTIDYIDVAGYDKVAFLGLVVGSSNAYRGYSFFDENKQNPIGTNFDLDTSLATFKPKTYIVPIPEGKKYLVTNVGVNFTKVFFCYGIKGTNIADDILSTIFNSIDNRYLEKDVLDDYYVEQSSSPNLIKWDSIITGKYASANKETYNVNGALSNKLYLESGKTYTFQNIVLFGVNKVAVYARYDENNKLISTVTINGCTVTGNDGSTSNGHQYGTGTFKYINRGEKYIRLTLQTLVSLGQLNNVQLEEGTETTTIVPYSMERVLAIPKKADVDNLTSRIKTIEEQTASTKVQIKQMSVTINKPTSTSYSVIVRSSISDTRDCAFLMESASLVNNSKTTNITFKKFYIGDNEIADNDTFCTLENEFNTGGDITSPLNLCKSNASGVYGTASVPIFHQHGFSIAKFTATGHTLDQNDLNSVWTAYDSDTKVGEFKLGKISGSSLYLIPQLANTTEGEEMYSYSYNGPHFNTIKHKSGALHTSDISGSDSRFDLPIQSIESTIFIADGNEVEEGTFQCNEFIITELVKGKIPFSVDDATDWFDDSDVLDTADDYVVFSKSFIFNGNSCTYNVSMDVKYPFKMNEYKFIQPMYMDSISNKYNSKVYIPKVKKTVGSVTADKGFSVSASAFNVVRHSNHLYDINDLPDRTYCVLEKSNNNENETDLQYLAGLAGGMSITRGITVPAVKNNQISINTASTPNEQFNNLCIRWIRDAGNKIYFRHFLGIGDEDEYQNSHITTDFTSVATGYISIFDPNNNPGQQVFWYKEGDYWIVFCHTQTLTGKTEVKLPVIFEGMNVIETIEKTAGTKLLTDVVTNGKVYVKYKANTSGQANFIVFKLR